MLVWWHRGYWKSLFCFVLFSSKSCSELKRAPKKQNLKKKFFVVTSNIVIVIFQILFEMKQGRFSWPHSHTCTHRYIWVSFSKNKKSKHFSVQRAPNSIPVQPCFPLLCNLDLLHEPVQPNYFSIRIFESSLFLSAHPILHLRYTHVSFLQDQVSIPLSQWCLSCTL